VSRPLYEYLAFILKLLWRPAGAGMAHLHGKKGKAMVHIGAVDAAGHDLRDRRGVEECVKPSQCELHVLGWEWRYGVSCLDLTNYPVIWARRPGMDVSVLDLRRSD